MLDYNEFYLTLIRHGQSTTNENPDLMGQEADTPLSPKGRMQAEALGKRLHEEDKDIDYVFSSTYTRAHDTAKIALSYVAHPEIQLVHDLREYSAGDWVGASRSDTITMPVVARMAACAHGFLPPNGESLHQVERRASKWVEDAVLYNQEIKAKAAEYAKTKKVPNILVFSHGMTIKCLLHYIMGFDQSFTWKVTIENTSMSKLYFGREGWRLLSINDTAHLTGV